MVTGPCLFRARPAPSRRSALPARRFFLSTAGGGLLDLASESLSEGIAYAQRVKCRQKGLRGTKVRELGPRRTGMGESHEL